MPLTASKTAAATRATGRPVNRPVVPEASTVSLAIFIHSSTGSEAAAAGAAVRSAAAQIETQRRDHGIDPPWCFRVLADACGIAALVTSEPSVLNEARVA